MQCSYLIPFFFLAEVSNQMLELYEQNRVPPSQASEAEGSAGGSQRPPSKAPMASEDNVNSHAQGSGATSKTGVSKSASSRPITDQSYSDSHAGSARSAHDRNNDSETHSLSDQKVDEINYNHEREQFHHQGNSGEVQNTARQGSEAYGEEEQEKSGGRMELKEVGEVKDKYHGRILEHRDGAVAQSPQDFKKQLGDKVKAVREKRKKLAPEVSQKTDVMDEEEMIERQLEDEIVLENTRSDREKKQRSKSSNRPEHDNVHHGEVGDGHYQVMKGHEEDFDNVEEGEVEFDDADRGYQSPRSNNRKRKAGSPVDKTLDGKQRHDYMAGSNKHNHNDFPEDNRRVGRLGYSERDHKRHVQENHV